ncbi:unnamed protein product [Durusdinium trenchii]|uniref:Uncharacterized protein n=1 Tax=Durusdinium trenchii TaxID=1381693 RepID=A0ABP0T1V1_9DINO
MWFELSSTPVPPESPAGQFYDAFQEAALDSTCNSLAMSADSPATMLSNIEDRRLSPSKPQVSESCVTWNCRVLLRAFVRSLSPQLTGPGACTNSNPPIKPPWQATDCTCDAETITMAQATSFRTLCGSMAAGLRIAVYDRHVASKDACYQGSMAAAAAAYPLDIRDFAIDTNCESILQNSQSTLEWFAVRDYITKSLASGGTSATYPIASYCRKVMCTAFVATLQLPECNFENGTYFTSAVVTTTTLDAIATDCANEGMTLTTASMCAEPAFNVSSYCAANNVRRLDELDMDLNVQPGVKALLASLVPERKRDQEEATVPEAPIEEVSFQAERHTSFGHAALQNAVVGFDGVEVFDQNLDDLENCGGNFCTSDRRLQTATTAPATAPASNLQEYTTTPWSTCTCYMQCIPGVRTRSVSCPAGVTCQEPKPSSAQSCVCKHCSDCDVLLFVLITAFAYLFQGVVSFLLWLGFLVVAFLEEDDYIDMSIGLKCIGCFCKFLSIITKIMTYATMLLIILLTITALVPIGDAFSDCKDNATFTMLAIGGICVWVVQLIVGVYMHKYKPMPPWLHTASSSGIKRLFFKPLNVVGP